MDEPSSGSSILSAIWNSNAVRAIIPDMIGIHFSSVSVPIIGGGGSFNIDLITRGKDAGFHKSTTFSARLGAEAGVGVSINQGWYLGSGENVTYASLMGLGADGNGAFGPYSIGVWTSVDTNAGQPSWLGTSIGTGWGFGGSGGISNTWGK